MHALVAVDPHHSAAHLARKAVGACDIPGPKSTAEAILRAVGDGERLLVVAESQHGDEGAKHFFLRDTITRRLGLHYRWLHVTTQRERWILGRRATQQHSATLFSRVVYIAQHAVAMLNARQGPHLRLWIERISKSNGF